MRLPVKINAILYRKKNDTTQIAVFHRIDLDFWQTISGGYETTDGELPETVIREVKEEAGLNDSDIISQTEQVHFLQYLSTECKHVTVGTDEKVWISEFFYGVRVKEDANVRLDKNIYPEHDEFKWCGVEQALELLKWDANRQAVKKLMTYLDNPDNQDFMM